MKTLRGKTLKWLAWLFWKLRITTEKDYVNFIITMKAVEAGLRTKEVPVNAKNSGYGHELKAKRHE